MSLFDKILKAGNQIVKEVTSEESKATAKAIIGTVGNAVDDAAKGVKKYVDEAKTEAEQKKAAAEAAAQTAPKANIPADSSDLSAKAKLMKVLAEEFPQYSVRENVSPTELGGTGRFMNYSLGVYNGNAPVLFIMVIGKTTCAHREYKWSKQAAENNGVQFINFIEHYPNEMGYIADRLHKYL